MLPITDEMNQLIAKANANITRIQKWYEKNEEAFHYMNLKLYGAFFYDGSDEMKKDFPFCYKEETKNEERFFHTFCDDCFRVFDEWCEEEFGVPFSKLNRPLGRTSSFYLYDSEIIQFDRNEIDWGETMDCAMLHFYNGNGVYTQFNCDGIINTYETFAYTQDDFYYVIDEDDLLNDIKEELGYIATDLFNDFVKEFETTIRVYEYIKEIKDNQVEYFKDWLEPYELDFGEQTRKANEYAAERIKICDQFEDKAIFSMMINSNVSNEGIQYLVDVMKGDKA